MGEGNGGYRVCLDLVDGGIYSHDIRMSDGDHPTLRIASEFAEFFLSWSEYCFSPFRSGTSYEDLTSYMWGKNGDLVWRDDLFHPSLKIGRA